ncbi:uncharacterized protein V6R79_022639 [Siganus canaliculatus]
MVVPPRSAAAPPTNGPGGVKGKSCTAARTVNSICQHLDCSDRSYEAEMYFYTVGSSMENFLNLLATKPCFEASARVGHHPLKYEGGLRPNQLWVSGHMQNPAAETEEDLQNLELYGMDWETFHGATEEPFRVQVPRSKPTLQLHEKVTSLETETKTTSTKIRIHDEESLEAFAKTEARKRKIEALKGAYAHSNKILVKGFTSQQKFDRDYQQSSLFCFTETWLTGDAELQLDGFETIRFDRDAKATRKSIGGGLCITVNKRWATNFTLEDASDLFPYVEQILDCGYTGPISIDNKERIIRAVVLHMTTKRIPMLQQIHEGLKVYNLIEVMQQKPNECHDLFVTGCDDKVDSHYILSHLSPDMSPHGSGKHKEESKILEYFQDFLIELEGV